MSCSAYSFKLMIPEKVAEISANKSPFGKIGRCKYFRNETSIFVFGSRRGFLGNSLQQLLFAQLWEFNFCCFDWKQIELKNPILEETLMNSYCFNKKCLFVFNERQNDADLQNRLLNVFNLNDMSNINEIETKGEIPPPTIGHSVVHAHNFLFCFGGLNTVTDIHTADMYRLNLSDGNWKLLHKYSARENEPSPRYYYGVASYLDFIYIIGGEFAANPITHEVVHAFHKEKHVWYKLNTIPDDRCGAALSCYPTPRVNALYFHTKDSPSVYLYGGFFRWESGDILNDLWKLELGTLQWTCITVSLIPSIPEHVHIYSATITHEGHMYVYAQEKNEDHKLKDKMHTVYAVWLTIPQLVDLCWDALLYYSPHIHSYSKDYLLKIGIPLRLLKQLE